jgi:hypothetical protein
MPEGREKVDALQRLLCSSNGAWFAEEHAKSPEAVVVELVIVHSK